LAPALAGNFKIVNAPQSIGSAKYTLRAIRAGYLYTYDEARKQLKAYYVTPQGQLWNFPTYFHGRPPADTTFRCLTPLHADVARCIGLVHQKGSEATNFWLGWSSVQWTKDLIAKVDNALWRKKHMQCINVPAMIAGKADHAGEFVATHKAIAHFELNEAAMKQAFSFSNTPVENEVLQHSTAKNLSLAMSQLAPYHKGFVVAVNDPVGITNDLSELVVPNIHSGFDEEMYRGKMIANLLAELEESTRAKAKYDVVLKDEEEENSENFSYVGAKAGGWRAPSVLAKKRHERASSLEKRQQEEADKAWHELTYSEHGPVLDEARIKNFDKIYDAAIKQFEPRRQELELAHTDWLRSNQLAMWMDGVHDKADIRSGYAYNNSIAQCIGKAVTTKTCSETLLRWLSSPDQADVSNLYSRGLLFNNEELVAATKKELGVGDFQFENLLGIYEEALERAEHRDRAAMFDGLALASGSILVTVLSKTATVAARGIALAHLTLLARCSIKETKLSPNELAKWAIKQAKLEDVQLAIPKKALRPAMYREAKRALAETNNKSYRGFELDIAELERTGRIKAGTITGIKIPGVDITRQWLGSSTPHEFQLGVAASLFQLVALGLALGDLSSSDRIDAQETQVKCGLAVISLSSTIVKTIGETVEKSSSHPLAFYIKEQWKINPQLAPKAARFAEHIGATAGFLAAAYDLTVNANRAFDEGDYVLGYMYETSGAIGILLFASTMGWIATGTFWPLMAASFLAGLAIAKFKAAAMKEWVSRCYFSKHNTEHNATQHYINLNEELTAYQTAIEG
jgi:hypothetical protein